MAIEASGAQEDIDNRVSGRNTAGVSHFEYVEARRLAAERYFFARNPKLVRKAKELHGYSCQVCKFIYADHYGEIGKDYVEAHHVNPLSERPEVEWAEELRTRVDDIAVVCANDSLFQLPVVKVAHSRP